MMIFRKYKRSRCQMARVVVAEARWKIVDHRGSI
jgi:hypothetical protein